MAIGNDITATAANGSGRRLNFQAADPTRASFFWLSVFFVVYCARPGDYVPLLGYLPLAKISGILAMWGLFNAVGRTKRTLKDLPREARLLFTMVGLLFIGGFLSPVWKGGAVTKSVEFSKICIAWALTFLLITTFERLRRIIFIQAISVVVACSAAIAKGHNVERLNGVLGGIYSNPNDLAFAVVLALPFALLFMETTKNVVFKVLWMVGMLIMLFTIFLTASRAGFIDLVISGVVTLYFFAVKGKRPYLLLGTLFAAVLIAATVGGKLYDRFEALSGDTTTEKSAYGSFQDRVYLMERAVEAIETYPVFGIGAHNFTTYSGIWRDVHMTYLQICSEGGIPVFILYLMFFWQAFKNLKILRKRKDLGPDMTLFVGALTSSLVGFTVGAVFAPEAYQYFPYFSVAFIATMMQTIKERDQELSHGPGPDAPPPKRGRHFLEAYDFGRRDAVGTVR
ncbi:MAG TPA: O-antigen ligase family protein [Terriglobales bacterium]|nr:O-antigen ligase family protein [Terriglobales bacterium]